LSDTTPRKFYWRQIGISIAAGLVLTVGSCFGFLTSFMHKDVLSRIFVVGFFAGGIIVVVASIWLLLEVIRAMLHK
jgi:hypothetical protein